jgi:SPP1 gp7 family putative phage head morphogenesis protein
MNKQTIIKKSHSIVDTQLAQAQKTIKPHAAKIYRELLSLANQPFKSVEFILGHTKPIVRAIAVYSADTRQQAEQLSINIYQAEKIKRKTLATLPTQALVSIQNMPLSQITEMYLPQALKEVLTLHELFAKRVKKAILESVEKGEHTNAAIVRLKQTLNGMGLSLQPTAYETITRTMIHSSFEEGRQAINNDPAVQDILKGYTYSATQDDRARPEHIEQDGKYADKNDPIIEEWRTLLQDYNCRCTLIEEWI